MKTLQRQLTAYMFFGNIFLAVSAFFRREREMLFRVRPKHHYLAHQDTQLLAWKINQSAFHTSDEESFLGKAKPSGQNVMAALPPRDSLKGICYC